MHATLFIDENRRPLCQGSDSWIRVRTGKLAIETIHDLIDLNSHLELDIYLDPHAAGYDVAQYIIKNHITQIKHIYLYDTDPLHIDQLLSSNGWTVEKINKNKVLNI